MHRMQKRGIVSYFIISWKIDSVRKYSYKYLWNIIVTRHYFRFHLLKDGKSIKLTFAVTRCTYVKVKKSIRECENTRISSCCPPTILGFFTVSNQQSNSVYHNWMKIMMVALTFDEVREKRPQLQRKSKLTWQTRFHVIRRSNGR